FIHHAQLQRRRLVRILNSCDDAMKDVKQQRLEQRGIRAHRFEIENLQAVDGQRIVQVIEQAGVTASIDPLVKSGGEHARQKIRDGEEATLRSLQHVHVLDRVVHLTVLEIT